MLLVTAQEMRALDHQMIAEIGVPGVVLMESAGRGVADVIGRLKPALGAVAVFAGRGNNGGDGFVTARHLAGRGVQAQVVLACARDQLAGDARQHFIACENSGVRVLDGGSQAALAAAAGEVAGAEVVVDALLGTGLERPISGQLAAAVEAINRHPGLKVAVDIPSGLDSDRGVPLGACVRADHTVTFAFAKLGLVSAPGFTFAGQVHVVDIGIPEALARAHGIKAELLSARVLDPLRRPRDPLGHKGSFGHLLVVAGSRGKTGAALLAGRAALALGVGLCTVMAPEEAQRSIDGRVPELMSASYGPADPLDLQTALAALERELAGKRALAVGPGIPTGAGMRPLLAGLCRAAAQANVSLVIDADGLNHLASDPRILEGARVPGAETEIVLTPHPGEAARLLGRSSAEVQADRIGSAHALAARFQSVAVLKGARTLIAAPGGRLAVCPTGNPGMATGGTGDVLTGMVGALLAQGVRAFDAACAAVFLHGAAGDLAATRRGQLSLVAHDVIDVIPEVIQGR